MQRISHKGTGKGTKNRRMSTAQRLFLIDLIGRGLNSKEIDKACSKHRTPFHPSAQVINYWRMQTDNAHKKLISNSTSEVWSEGLARSEERVKVLKSLAERLLRDLAHGDDKKEKIWLDQMKGLGPGRTFSYKEFNGAEFRELRGILDDIAKETGGRQKKSDEAPGGGSSRLASLPADVLAPSFLNVYRDARDRKHMEYLLMGGRGSTKSSFTSLMIIYLMMNNPEVHGLILRQVANTLRDSVYAQLVWAIQILGLEDQFKCITSPMEIEYLPTHQKLYFRGADKPEMIKSIKPVFGYIGILWFEELDQFHGAEAIRKIEQSTLRGGQLAWEFKTYNPPKTAANWVNKYAKIPKANQYQHSSTYIDVPFEWLGQTFIDEAEHLRETNPDAYRHEYLGEVTGTGGLVFENVRLRKITQKERDSFERPAQGIDWGYFPDPFVWGKSYYDVARHTLYIYDELVLRKTGNEEAYKRLVRDKGVKPSEEIIADSAEPKSIGDFIAYGQRCRGAEKGPESVNYSMKWLQSLAAIVIDNVSCPLHAEEFTSYELDMDKDGNYITGYPDRDNHAIDEVRYAHNLVWRRRGK